MFARSAFISLLALPGILTAATGAPSGGVNNSCNTGVLLCCNEVLDSKSLDKNLSGLCASLGIDVSAVTGGVGFRCDPITVIGASGTSCSAQPVCCTDNNFNGLVALGCTRVNLNA